MLLNRFVWPNKIWQVKYLVVYGSRKEEAVNRPKFEFVPKTLADLHIEGIHDLNHGRRYGSAQSLSRARLPPTSSLGDLPTSDPLRAWEEPRAPRGPSAPRISLAPAAPRFKPHPAPRSAQIQNGRDPWTGDFFFICFLIFDYVSCDSSVGIALRDARWRFYIVLCNGLLLC